jgi:hypothetical protein
MGLGRLHAIPTTALSLAGSHGRAGTAAHRNAHPSPAAASAGAHPRTARGATPTAARTTSAPRATGNVTGPATITSSSPAQTATTTSTGQTSADTTGAAGTPPTAGPAAGRTLVFGDEFDTLEMGPGKTWGYETSSYAFGDHNPDNYKRDWITPDAMRVDDGVLTITATRRDSFYWNTGLLTTENAYGSGGNGFRVQAGDLLVNRVRMPTGNTGAWPALWTWDGPRGEVDAFEWHSDVPNVLEFSNYVRSGNDYYNNRDLVAPGQWVWIGVRFGTDDDTWYVGDSLETMRPVFSDGTGIGKTRPFVIANLSVNVSPWHPGPSGSDPIVYQVDCVRVYR